MSSLFSFLKSLSNLPLLVFLLCTGHCEFQRQLQHFLACLVSHETYSSVAPQLSPISYMRTRVWGAGLYLLSHLSESPRGWSSVHLCVGTRFLYVLIYVISESVHRRGSGVMHSRPRGPLWPISLKLFLKPEFIISGVCAHVCACAFVCMCVCVRAFKMYINCISQYFSWGPFLVGKEERLKIMCVLEFLPYHYIYIYLFLLRCIFNHSILIKMFVSSVLLVLERTCKYMDLLSCMQFCILWEGVLRCQTHTVARDLLVDDDVRHPVSLSLSLPLYNMQSYWELISSLVSTNLNWVT